MENKKIQDFKDLKAWQEGHGLVILVYKITKNFPREETYSLVDQMRRAAVSVTSNIAEGFGRHNYKEKANFYRIAQGSLTELENQIVLSKDIGYLKKDLFEDLYLQLKTTQRLLGGLIAQTKSFITQSNLQSPISNLRSLISVLSLILISSLCSLISPSPAAASTISLPSNYLFMNSGLVGYWTFDGKDTPWTSATAATTLDKSGNGNTGTLTGMNRATAPVVGKIGQGLKFNGLNSGTYINLGNSTNLNPANFTISAWVLPNSGASNYYNYIYSNARDCCGTYNGIELVIFGGTPYLAIWNSTAYTVNAGRAVPDNKWVHITGTYNGTTMRIYLDGVLANSDDTGLGVGSPASYNVAIGGMGMAPGTYTMLGKIDDVRLYSRALSASEVTQLYNQGAAKFAAASDQALTSGLVGYWTFDGKDINWGTNKVTDKSGNGNTGTITNMSTTTSPVVGKIGQGLLFDGVDDYVNLGTNSILTPADITISAWVKANQLSSWSGIISNMTSWGTGFSLQIGTVQNIAAMISGTYLTTTWAPSVGVWYHVVATHNSSNNYNVLYVNGNYENSSTQAVSYEANVKTYIGVFYTSPNLLLNGIIDDVRIYNRALSASEVRQLYNLGAVKLTPTGSVVGRYVFYNNSAWDGNDASANALDDSAIAPDKQALLPGGTATFSNYTSYLQGINGVMVDISGSHPNISASDFTFKVGNDNSPAGWSVAATPAVTIRAGAGTGSSSRVTIIWPDATVQKQWLQVTVKATVNTGLSANDVFYFGNAIGEVGNDPTSAVVNGVDEALIAANPRTFLNPAPIDFWYDIDRNKRVDLSDQILSRNNSTTSSTALQLITVP